MNFSIPCVYVKLSPDYYKLSRFFFTLLHRKSLPFSQFCFELINSSKTTENGLIPPTCPISSKLEGISGNGSSSSFSSIAFSTVSRNVLICPLGNWSIISLILLAFSVKVFGLEES